MSRFSLSPWRPALAGGRVKGLSCFVGDSLAGTTHYYGADKTGTISEPQYMNKDYKWDLRLTRKSDTGNQFEVLISAAGGHAITFLESTGGRVTNGVSGMGDFMMGTHFLINFKVDGQDQFCAARLRSTARPTEIKQPRPIIFIIPRRL